MGVWALRFIREDIALLDICILKRSGAEKDYEPEQVKGV